MPEVTINNDIVNFSLKPYSVQEDYMAKVIECLQNSTNGGLVFLTDTGKILCHLCSSLSWLLIKKLDEAHNIEKTCEETASLQISSTDIAMCIDEVTAIMEEMAHSIKQEKDFLMENSGNVQQDFTVDLCILKAMFLEVLMHGKEQLVIEKLEKIVLYLTTTTTSLIARKVSIKLLMKESVHTMRSGTLSRLKTFITELGIPVDVQLEKNPHIVKGDQLCVGVLGQGPDGYSLNFSCNTRNDPKYVASLSRIILNFSCLITSWFISFFPLYRIMKKCREEWQNTGLWTKISDLKVICMYICIQV
ncbi:Regulator of telomere elongation helicase 1 like protein [Dufourea novaeangliae]|uniref:Regulator of telomere elongation helicase 1 like protein n=1 Tax=Dufourea novaeangliae TaxID=178035 RepID=A0A154PSZ9_DUFNO|nr:Regulator of telomere elongation helicase 1 like protein [Dufourea novaeangliae]